MRHSRKLLAAGAAILCCCVLSLVYSHVGTGGSASSSGADASHQLNGQLGGDDYLRLESWGECFQSAPSLFVAAASLQADHVGRSQLRRAWAKWHVAHSTAQLMFFLRHAATASRRATVDEFHASQDVIVDSKLPRQDDLAMLQWATAWFLDRCHRTPYLLFALHGAAVNPRLVSLHATGGVDNSGAAARLPFGVGIIAVGGNQSSSGGQQVPDCLLLSKEALGLVQQWPTTWHELLSIRGFNASVKDATQLFCSQAAGL